MKYAIIIDPEINYLRKLCRGLQLYSTERLWLIAVSVREACRLVASQSTTPDLLIYNYAACGAWIPPWQCRKIVLRPEPLLEDLISDGASVNFLAEHKAVYNFANSAYRLNFKRIKFFIDRLSEQAIETPTASSYRRNFMNLFVCDLEPLQCSALLCEQVELNNSLGRKTMLVPLMSAQEWEVYNLPAKRTDTGYELVRLPQFLLRAEQGGLIELRRRLNELRISAGLSGDACTIILIGHKTQISLIQDIAALCDNLQIISSSQALHSKSEPLFSEQIRSALPPGFPINECCLPAYAPQLTEGAAYAEL